MAVIDMETAITSTMPSNVTTEIPGDIPWVETFYGGFRVWQILFLAGGVLLAVG